MADRNEFENWKKVFRELQKTQGLPFSALLPAEKVDRLLAGVNVEFRDRIYTPEVTLWMFLSQVLSSDHSCRDTVARLLAWRAASGLSPCSAGTGSYCDARQRLPLELLQGLVREEGRELEQQADENILWKGRHVKISDGTTATMPDTAANQAVYPQSRNQAPGVGFPIVRIMFVISWTYGTVLDLAEGPMRGKKTGENTLLRGLGGVLQKGDVLLLDRLLGSYQQFSNCRDQGVDVVARQHQSRKTDFRRGRWLGTLDHIVTWHRPKFDSLRFDRATWEALPKTMKIRELRFHVTQPGFRPADITIATTLLDPIAYPAADLAALYRERWHCELDLRSLKTSLQMTHLRCKTPEMVRKEIWAHCLAYNLIRKTMAESARHQEVLPRHLSFKGAVQTMNSFAPYLALCVTDKDGLWAELLAAIAAHVVGNRPNRLEPRKLKYRLGKFTYMTRPRTEERRTLCS
jgi:Transposase DDE domain